MDNGASSYRRFLDGDEGGLYELIQEYRDGLILYLTALTGDVFIAEEAAEDTFVKLWIKRPKDTGKASFKTYLYAIGRNAARDRLRRRAASKELPAEAAEAVAEAEEDLETLYLREEQKRILHRALRRLSPEYRQVLWLVYFEDFSHKDAAKVMKKTPHGIDTLVWRARQALKSELDKENFDLTQF